VAINPFNQRNTQYGISSTKEQVRKNKLFMQNKANFQKVKLNITKVITRNYVQMDTWSIRKTKPIQSQLKPIKANSKPIQSQLKPILCQNKANSNPTCRSVASGEAGNKPNFYTIGFVYCLQLPLSFANLLRNFVYGYE
jgi:hypothetical protein